MRRALLGMAVVLLAGCQVVGPERFAVFFSPWSAELDVPAKQVVDTVALRARQRPGAKITVSGYANAAVGTADENRRVAAQRAQAVVAALGRAGVPAARIQLHSRGGGDHQLDPVEARRVEITLGEP